MLQVEKLTKWIHSIPIEDYFEVARARPPGLGKDPRFLQLQREMRALVPVEGLTWVHDIDVLIEPGQTQHQGQRRHSHVEWTSIFYVDPAGIFTHLELPEGEVAMDLEPGDVLVIPPGVEHWVAPHHGDRPRLSFAMLVKEPGVPSKYDN